MTADEGANGLGETYAGVFVPDLVARLVEIIGEPVVDLDPFLASARLDPSI